MARALRGVVDAAVERRLRLLTRGRAVGAELRDLRGALVRLERRCDSLARRIGAGVRRTRSRGVGSPGRPPLHEGCRVEGCRRDHYALGLCSRHYQQYRRGRLPSTGAGAGKRNRGRSSRGAARAGRPRSGPALKAARTARPKNASGGPAEE